MTLSVVLAALVIGVAVGEFWFRLRRDDEFLRGLLAGQWQSDLTHGLLPDVGEQRPVLPEPRRRSPNVKADRGASRQPAPLERAVLHRTR